jgi:hypothetical protein
VSHHFSIETNSARSTKTAETTRAADGGGMPRSYTRKLRRYQLAEYVAGRVGWNDMRQGDG